MAAFLVSARYPDRWCSKCAGCVSPLQDTFRNSQNDVNSQMCFLGSERPIVLIYIYIIYNIYNLIIDLQCKTSTICSHHHLKKIHCQPLVRNLGSNTGLLETGIPSPSEYALVHSKSEAFKALFRRGKALLSLGDGDRAEKDLKKILEVGGIKPREHGATKTTFK